LTEEKFQHLLALGARKSFHSPTDGSVLRKKKKRDMPELMYEVSQREYAITRAGAPVRYLGTRGANPCAAFALYNTSNKVALMGHADASFGSYASNIDDYLNEIEAQGKKTVKALVCSGGWWLAETAKRIEAALKDNSRVSLEWTFFWSETRSQSLVLDAKSGEFSYDYPSPAEIRSIDVGEISDTAAAGARALFNLCNPNSGHQLGGKLIKVFDSLSLAPTINKLIDVAKDNYRGLNEVPLLTEDQIVTKLLQQKGEFLS
jgi:hypothetical protein